MYRLSVLVFWPGEMPGGERDRRCAPAATLSALNVASRWWADLYLDSGWLIHRDWASVGGLGVVGVLVGFWSIAV